MSKISDQEIIGCILSGKDRQALDHLYAIALPVVKRYVLNNNGTDEEAKDIFQDAVLVFYKQVTEGKYDKISDVSRYIFGIAKNYWIKKALKNKQHTNLETVTELEENDPDPHLLMVVKEKSELLNDLMSELGEKCRQILYHTVYEKKSMEEIADLMNLSGADSAKATNYKCKKKLMKIIQEQPHALQLFRYDN